MKRQTQNSFQKALRILIAFCLLLESWAPPVWAANWRVSYQGNLRQSGVPVTGNHAVLFRIYASSDGGVPLWTGPTQDVSFNNGQFFTTFEPSGVDWEAVDPLLEIAVDGVTLTPREQLTATPYALNSRLLGGKRYVSAATAPASPVAGDFWFDTSDSILRYHNGSSWISPAAAGGLVSDPAQSGGDGTALNPLRLRASSVTLQGNTFNVANSLVLLDPAGLVPVSLLGGIADAQIGAGAAIAQSKVAGLESDLAGRVLRSGDAITGDLQVGAAAASTISASGFITMANLTAAPAPEAGRLYYDASARSGDGALMIRLNTGSFVPIATGTASELTRVSAEPAQFGGDGTPGAPLTLAGSSVTLQGNAFNAANLLLRLDPAGLIPAAHVPSLDASKIGSGTFGDERVAVSTAAVTGGKWTDAHIAAGAAIAKAKIDPSTQWTAGEIPSLDASKIGSGTFGDARVA
ncbi:MAG: hypothetical protein HY554_03040, partial [Elusimicrobia bacterium]|nr:hypothetical protein [Elusimicrobiota bacterium]